jgi:hypothetical protein
VSLQANFAAALLATDVFPICFRVVSWVPENGFVGIPNGFLGNQAARLISPRMEAAAQTNSSAPSVVVTAADSSE